MRHPFNLTRSDRRAVLVLMAIAFVCLSGIVLFGTQQSPGATPLATDSAHVSPSSPVTPHSAASYERQPFDPNTVDSATLVRMGISPRRVHTFMRYRSAGARFSRPEDIMRCYSFSDQDIDLLLPLVRIAPRYRDSDNFTRTKYPLPSSSSTPTASPSTTHAITHGNKFTTLTEVDINTADTALLRRIPGIGEAIASMIINLREKFGGFTSLSQLSQIHQISPELYQWFTLADTVPYRRIPINEASFKTLVTHPYVTKDQANAILHYIRIYGPIKDIATLRATAIFTQDQLTSLEPYLQF